MVARFPPDHSLLVNYSPFSKSQFRLLNHIFDIWPFEVYMTKKTKFFLIFSQQYRRTPE